jgi:hypothetical protein
VLHRLSPSGLPPLAIPQIRPLLTNRGAAIPFFLIFVGLNLLLLLNRRLSGSGRRGWSGAEIRALTLLIRQRLPYIGHGACMGSPMFGCHRARHCAAFFREASKSTRRRKSTDSWQSSVESSRARFQRQASGLTCWPRRRSGRCSLLASNASRARASRLSKIYAMCVLRRGASGDRTVCGRETRFPTSPGMLAACSRG